MSFAHKKNAKRTLNNFYGRNEDYRCVLLEDILEQVQIIELLYKRRHFLKIYV
jgi:hypothetical protein